MVCEILFSDLYLDLIEFEINYNYNYNTLRHYMACIPDSVVIQAEINNVMCFVKTVHSAILGNGGWTELCSEEILPR
jgi:hypothetical protein